MAWYGRDGRGPWIKKSAARKAALKSYGAKAVEGWHYVLTKIHNGKWIHEPGPMYDDPNPKIVMT